MRRLLATAILVLLATGCWVPRATLSDGRAMAWGCAPITFSIEGDEEFGAVVRTIVAQVSSLSGHEFAEVPDGAVRIRHTWPSGPTANGWTDLKDDGTHYVRATILVNPALPYSPTKTAVIRHEFGHLLGMAHTSYPDSIMHEPMQVLDYTDVDRQGLWSLGTSC